MSQLWSQLLLHSPAKVNLCWQVGCRTREGWHQVRGAMVAVSWYDRLWMKRGSLPGIRLKVNSEEDLGEIPENLVWRAAQAFESEWPVRRLAVDMLLEKRIPSQAGLGGGSSDAAAALLGLQRLYGRNDGRSSSQRLLRIAEGLGADVPFFLSTQPSWVTERGQHLRPLVCQPPRLWLLIAKPRMGVETSWAYRQLQRPLSSSFPWRPSATMHQAAEVAAHMQNDLASVVSSHYPELEQLRTHLLNAGALQAMLSGSGSAVFGVFANFQLRNAAWMKLLPHAHTHHWQLYCCHSLRRHNHFIVPACDVFSPTPSPQQAHTKNP